MGKTTKNGIWFPDGTDPSNIKTLLSTMASSIENKLGFAAEDSGWVDLTIRSGFAVQGSPSPAVRKEGKKVTMRGLVKRSSGSFDSGTNYIVAAIPSGYRPPWHQYFDNRTQSTGVHGSLEISPDGEISLGVAGTTNWVSLMGLYWYMD